jgi:hypothetical protein
MYEGRVKFFFTGNVMRVLNLNSEEKKTIQYIQLCSSPTTPDLVGEERGGE